MCFFHPFLAQAACRSIRTTALATNLTATVEPCARAVCYWAPTCIRLAAQHSNWLSPRNFLLGGARSRYWENYTRTFSTKKYNSTSYNVSLHNLPLFSPFGIFFSPGRGSFLVLSAPWHTGSPPGPHTEVWVLAEVRGTCSGGSNWHVRSGRYSEHVGPSRPMQTHVHTL